MSRDTCRPGVHQPTAPGLHVEPVAQFAIQRERLLVVWQRRVVVALARRRTGEAALGLCLANVVTELREQIERLAQVRTGGVVPFAPGQRERER